MQDFRHPIEVRWSDCDMNQHVRHNAYADFCTQVRIEWLRANGFSFDRFQKEGFGPVLFKEWTEYYKELKLSERLMIAMSLAGLNTDKGRFAFRFEIYKEDGRLAARHEVTGAWFDLRTRKLMLPPAELTEIFMRLARTDDFSEMLTKND